MAVALAGSSWRNPMSKQTQVEDLLWKKLDARVSETVEKFDGVMGVAIVRFVTESRDSENDNRHAHHAIEFSRPFRKTRASSFSSKVNLHLVCLGLGLRQDDPASANSH